jgi:hypothetical protein
VHRDCIADLEGHQVRASLKRAAIGFARSCHDIIDARPRHLVAGEKDQMCIMREELAGPLTLRGPGLLAPLVKQLLAIEIVHCQEYTLEIIPPDDRWDIRHRLPNGYGCLPEDCQAIIFGQCRPIVAFYPAL